MNSLAKVIIVGRANTGKSTLFNRLIEKPKALTSKTAGTTRDINIGQVYWQGVNFELIDTGGIDSIIPTKKIKEISPDLNIDYALDIINQTQAALKLADVIVFITDIQAGLMPQDKELVKSIKKINKPIVFVANKTDAIKYEERAAEFYKLGLGQPFFVSAINGLGTGDLLDEIVIKLKKAKKLRKSKKIEIKNPIKISIVGKPNVGKSSLLNSIIGEQRVIVSEKAHTTREAVDTLIVYNKRNIILIDTAGVRKQARIKPGLEKISVKKSLMNAKNSDICLLLIDISQPIDVQDNKLSKILIDAQVSIIIVANKWDKIPDKETNTQKELIEHIHNFFPYLKWAPIIFTSALTGQHVHKILGLAMEINENRKSKIPENSLSKFLKQAIKKHRPKATQGTNRPFLTNLNQVRTNPPKFEITVKQNKALNSAYIKYLENALRQKFKLNGTPIKIVVKGN